MCQGVFLELVCTRKGLGAYLTAVGLLPGVRIHVPVEMVVPGELFLTDSTLVRPDTSVYQLVPVEVVAPGEELATLFTLVRLDRAIQADLLAAVVVIGALVVAVIFDPQRERVRDRPVVL